MDRLIVVLLVLFWGRDREQAALSGPRSAPLPLVRPHVEESQENEFYAPGWNVWECGAAALLLVLMSIAATQADQKLAAFGLTLITLATLLAAPTVLGNSVGRYVQARALKRWAAQRPMRAIEDPAIRRSVVCLSVISGTAAGVAVAGTVMLFTGAREAGIWLVLASCLVLMLAATFGYLLSAAGMVWSFAKEDAALVEQDIRKPDPRDYAAAAAGVALLSGVLLTFADVYLPE